MLLIRKNNELDVSSIYDLLNLRCKAKETLIVPTFNSEILLLIKYDVRVVIGIYSYVNFLRRNVCIAGKQGIQIRVLEILNSNHLWNFTVLLIRVENLYGSYYW